MAFPDSNIFAGQDQYDACFAFRFPKRVLDSEQAGGANGERRNSDHDDGANSNTNGFRPASRTGNGEAGGAQVAPTPSPAGVP